MAGPAARMILTIPVGEDAVFVPAHRVYGPKRLPLLLDGYRSTRQEFFAKARNDRRWRSVSRETALAVRGSAAFYALGLLVLAVD